MTASVSRAADDRRGRDALGREALDELSEVGVGLKPVAAGDPHELESPALLRVVGRKVRAERFDLLDGYLDQLGQQARGDRLDSAQQDRLDGAVLVGEVQHAVTSPVVLVGALDRRLERRVRSSGAPAITRTGLLFDPPDVQVAEGLTLVER